MKRVTRIGFILLIYGGFIHANTMDEYLLKEVLLSSKDEQKSVKEQNLKNIQDEELFKLLLISFLGNNDVENAYQIAKKGVELFPKSYYWWEWYGKTALWTKRFEESLVAYQQLFKLNPTKKNLKNLFNMALASNRFDLASQLLVGNRELFSEIKSLKDLVYIFTQSGNIDELIKLLDKKFAEEKNPEYLSNLAYLNYHYNQIKQAIQNLEELSKYRPLNISEILLYSNSLYALKNYSKSYEVLKSNLKYIESLKPKDSEEEKQLIEYYQTLSDLGWFVRDFEFAVYASKKLIKLNQPRLVDYVRLYVYYFNKKVYQQSLLYAKEGYSRFKDFYLLTGYIESLNRLSKWKDIYQVLFKIDMRDLYKNPYLLSLYVKSVYKVEGAKKAKQILIEALKEAFFENLLSEAIFFSIETSDKDFARYILNNFKLYEEKIPRQFIALHMFLQNSQKALELLSKLGKESDEDLLFYADVLYTYGRTDEAEKIRYEIFRKLSKNLSDTYKDPQRLEMYLKVGINYLPAVELEKLFQIAKDVIDPAIFDDIYYSYLLKIEEHQKVEYIIKKHKKILRPWMYLNIALWQDDRFWQEELLNRYSDILPIRDRVEAFRRTGQINIAGYYGYKGLEENREDYLLYKQYRDLITTYYSKVDNTISYTNWDKVFSINENFLIRYYLTKGFYINYQLLGYLSVDSSNSIYKDLRSFNYHSFKIGKMVDDGYSEIGVSYLDGLKGNAGITFRYNRYLDNRTNIELSTGINQLSYESLYMFFGGMKDYINISLSHSLTNRAFIFGSINKDFYKSQDNKSVGDSFSMYGELFYKLRIGYPDYTFRIYIQNSNFNEKNTDKGVINKISSQPNPDVLPQSYSSVGAGFLFGFENRDNYVRVFRPFFSSDITFNSITGLGYGFSAGFGGTLFRQDNLSSGFRYIKDFKGTSTSFWEYFLKYLLLF
ncbi:MAG: tetratricopeptide repeat protein [Hydrogenothermaceae bacterium]